MKFEFVKVTGKITHETFGCDKKYFEQFIKNKPLQIIYSSSNHYIRVKDQNEEEWGLFKDQYKIQTGLGTYAAPKESQAEQKILSEKKT
jgi:hypothetical protein